MPEQHMALTIFLLIVFIGIYFLLSAIVIIKRHISIRKARNSKAGYTPIGHGLSKSVRDLVEQEINATCKVYVEPKTFTEEYENNFEDYSKRNDITYLYRLKVVEEYKELLPLIKLISCDDKSSKITDTNKEISEIISAFIDSYTNARHSYKPFTQGNYEEFSRMKRKLLTICTSTKKAAASSSTHNLEQMSHCRNRSNSIDSIDSQTALIESDQPESHMVADNSNDDFDGHLLESVRIRGSGTTGKRLSDPSTSRTC